MAHSIEHTIHDRLKVCGYRCENKHREGFRIGPIRCPNEHGKKAVTYKGVVSLLPHYLNKIHGDIEQIRMWCHKCSMEYAIEKQKTKNINSRPKTINKDQTDLFK